MSIHSSRVPDDTPLFDLRQILVTEMSMMNDTEFLDFLKLLDDKGFMIVRKVSYVPQYRATNLDVQKD